MSDNCPFCGSNRSWGGLCVHRSFVCGTSVARDGTVFRGDECRLLVTSANIQAVNAPLDLALRRRR